MEEAAIIRAGRAWTDERADEMRRLPEPVRQAAIEGSPNVVGFEQFNHRAKQVRLREAYRKPSVPK